MPAYEEWLGPQGIIAAGVVIGIYRTWRAERKIAAALVASDQRTAAALARANAEAKITARAATSEVTALISEKITEHQDVLKEMAGDMRKIELQGNSAQILLREAAEAAGRLAATAEAADVVAEATRKTSIAESDLARIVTGDPPPNAQADITGGAKKP